MKLGVLFGTTKSPAISFVVENMLWSYTCTFALIVQVSELQSELNTTLSRLENLEMQTREMTLLRNDLHVKDSEITSLKNQLTDEQINRCSSPSGGVSVYRHLSLLFSVLLVFRLLGTYIQLVGS